MQFWPLMPLDEDRTIVVRERYLAIIPYRTPEQLRQFDGQRVLLCGELITKPRSYRFATGYALYVMVIGVKEKTGTIRWHKIGR